MHATDAGPADHDEPRVAVFSPAPVLVTTIEHRPDGGRDVHVNVGGQGSWVARMLVTLGVTPTLCAPFGGETGEVALTRFGGSGVEVASVPTHASTALYLEERHVDSPRGCIAEVPPGPLPARDVDALYDATLQAALAAGTCVVSGSPFDGHLDDGVFGRLCADLRAAGVALVVDLSGAQLDAAIEGGVDWIKVAHDELAAHHGVDAEDEPALWAAADDLASRAGAAVVVSRSSDPTFVVDGGEHLVVVGPSVEPVDARGSGDAMTAALAAGHASGWDRDRTLRTAVAAGAANAVHRSSATASREIVDQLAANVTIEARSST